MPETCTAQTHNSTTQQSTAAGPHQQQVSNCRIYMYRVILAARYYTLDVYVALSMSSHMPCFCTWLHVGHWEELLPAVHTTAGTLSVDTPVSAATGYARS